MAIRAVPRPPTTATRPGPRPAGAGRPPDDAARDAWMDNLRVAVIAGVIVMHVATAYILDVSWYYEERTASEVTKTAFSVVFLPGAMFAMAVLFLVAGMLTARSLAGKGERAFWRGRLLRLGVPLVPFILVVDPLTSVLGLWGAHDYPRGFAAMVRYEFAHPGSGPMWFVVALLVFSAGYAAWRRIRPARPAGPLRGRYLVTAGAVIVAASFLIRLVWPFAGDTPLALNLWEWPQMAVLFALGTLTEERGWLDPPPPWLARACRRAAAVAGLAVVAVLVSFAAGADPDSFTGGLRPEALAEPVCEATIAIATSLWVVLWFRRHVSYRGRLAVALGRGSYATYLVHAPVVVALSALLHGVPVPVEVKFVVVAAAGLALSFGLGALVTPGRARPG